MILVATQTIVIPYQCSCFFNSYYPIGWDIIIRQKEAYALGYRENRY